MQVYRLRRGVALVEATVSPLIAFAVSAGIVAGTGPVVAEEFVAPAVIVLSYAVFLCQRARRRTLTVTDLGCEVQRDRYRLAASWGDVTGTKHRRVLAVLPVDEIHVRATQVIALDAQGRTTKLPAKLSGHPAATRIQVSFYDADWRDGPIGHHLRRAAVRQR